MGSEGNKSYTAILLSMGVKTVTRRKVGGMHMAFPVATRQLDDVCGGTPDCLVQWSQHDGRPTYEGVIDLVIMFDYAYLEHIIA